MAHKVILVLFLVSFTFINCFNDVEPRNEPIDSSFLENALDAQECQRQIRAIRRNSRLLLEFTDAGLRSPRGQLTGNLVDMGNYHQCLGINHQLDDMHIEGKYCSILVPFNQSFHLPSPQDIKGTQFDPTSLKLDNETIRKVEEYHRRRRVMLALSGDLDGFEPRSTPGSPFSIWVFRLAICVPKPCTTEQAINSFFFNISAVGFQYTDDYCRLPGDKTWVAADYIAVVFFALLGFVTLVSTSYDLSYRFLFKKDVKQMNVVCRSFSVYTNGQRLTTFSSNSGTLQCLDGIRTLAMSWVLIGHSFSSETFLANPVDLLMNHDRKIDIGDFNSYSIAWGYQKTNDNGIALEQWAEAENLLLLHDAKQPASFNSGRWRCGYNPDLIFWMFSASGLWITAATATVDTFFALAGVLLVYTTAGKMSQINFVKSLHWFYLNRFMRVTPLLAVTVLLEASYNNRFTDGPHWLTVADHTRRCRENWWSTLLHVQNFVHTRDMCVTHSWYVAIDFQLYVLSPLVHSWILSGKKHIAWTGLIGGLVAVLIGSTIYSFQLNMSAGVIVPTRFDYWAEYFYLYYYNTLCRASPFFVGLVFGYILHIHRKQRIQIPWMIAIFFWACSAGIMGGVIYFTYRIQQFDWDNQLVDNLLNSFMRPSWACAVCWLIVACVHGYAGPINWFLCLDCWRLPARLTYGMFLFHYPIMYSFNATEIAPVFFTVERFVFKFLSYLVLAVVYSFTFTLLVDSPITVLFKQLMDS